MNIAKEIFIKAKHLIELKKIKRREDSGALGTEWIEVYYNFIKEVQSVGKKNGALSLRFVYWFLLG